MSRLMAGLGVLLLGVALVAGCTGDATPPEPSFATQVQTGLPDAETTVLAGDGPVELAVAASRALYRSAPAVVLVGAVEEADVVERAGGVATTLGVPLLVTPQEPTGTPAPTPEASVVAVDQPAAADPRAEIERLGASTVLTVGPAAAQWATTLPAEISRLDDPAAVTVEPAAPLSSLLVLAQGGPADAAATATARAAGAQVVVLGGHDPRATSTTVQAVAEAARLAAGDGAGSVGPVLALGSAFGPAERLRQRVTIAATGVELPGGGQLVFPGRRMVALYGHPGDPGLGVLGEQPVEAAIARAHALAANYQGLVGEPVVPAFEIIVTVAAGTTGSMAHPVEKFRPWVEAARDAGVYVVLDLQPGDAHFLGQAHLYEELLRYPNVGLALDPEWRVQPGHQHMVQIGSVDAAEINEVGQWLARLTRDLHLPQKVFMLHQFTLGMISNRSALVTDYDELRVVIHADGFGSPGAKHNTWNTLHVDAPGNLVWGWKNFYDEDKPTFTPHETMSVSPEIVFVSYQ